jgi:hypothetical protein
MFLKVAATWKQASTSHLSSWLTEMWAESRLRNRLFPSLLSLSYLIFSCCQLPFCEFQKHTTAFHYRYDIQMYCTFVLFVNQHFPELPASETHCTICRLLRNHRLSWSLWIADLLSHCTPIFSIQYLTNSWNTAI